MPASRALVSSKFAGSIASLTINIDVNRCQQLSSSLLGLVSVEAARWGRGARSVSTPSLPKVASGQARTMRPMKTHATSATSATEDNKRHSRRQDSQTPPRPPARAPETSLEEHRNLTPLPMSQVQEQFGVGVVLLGKKII